MDWKKFKQDYFVALLAGVSIAIILGLWAMIGFHWLLPVLRFVTSIMIYRIPIWGVLSITIVLLLIGSLLWRTRKMMKML